MYLLAFDIVPLFFIFNEDYKNPPVWLIIIVYPIICFAVGFVTGIKNGFVWHSLLIPFACFLPSAFIYYTSGAVGYGAFYLMTCAIGLALGSLIFRSKRNLN